VLRGRVAIALVAAALVGALAGSLPATGSKAPGFDSIRFNGSAPRVGAVRSAPAVTWCGADESQANRSPEVELSATPTSRCYWARQFLSWLERRSRCAGGFEIKQMLLTFSLNNLLRAPAVDPSLQGA